MSFLTVAKEIAVDPFTSGQKPWLTVAADDQSKVVAIDTSTIDGCRLVRRALVMMGSEGHEHELALAGLREALKRHRRAQQRSTATYFLTPSDTRRKVADAVMRIRLCRARIEKAAS